MFRAFDKSTPFKGFPNLNFKDRRQNVYGYDRCVFWLDAAYTPVNTNLAAIPDWTDKISGYMYLNPSGGSQPRLVTADAGFNNLPVVEFLKGRTLSVSGPAPIWSKKNTTLAIVFKKTQDADTNNNNITCPLFSDGSVGGVFHAFLTSYSTSPNVISSLGAHCDLTRQFYTNTLTDTNTHLMVLSGTTWYNNGAIVTNLATHNNHNVRIVRLNGTSVQGAHKIAEILLFDREFSATECLALSDAINIKYALY